MGNKIGIQVVESTANVSPSIVPSDLTDTGILFESERGPASWDSVNSRYNGVPVNITSLAQDRLLFGVPRPSLEKGSLVKRCLFKNAGQFGVSLQCVRVVGGTSQLDAQSSFTTCKTKIAALVTGTGGNSYRVTVSAGTISGTKKIQIDNLPSSPTVSEIFDNVTVTNFGDAINRGLVLGGLSGGVAHTDGSPSTLVKVVYVGSTLPDNVAATALTGGATGVAASLNLTVAAAVNTVIGAGQLGYADPGLWGNSLYLTIAPHPNAEHLRDITIERLINGTFVTVESWNAIPTVPSTVTSTPLTFGPSLNSPDTGSSYIRVVSGSSVPDATYTRYQLGQSQAGAEVSPTSSDFLRFLSALDGVDVQLITQVDSTTVTDAINLGSYAASRRAIAISPIDYGVSTATIASTWTPALMAYQTYQALYRGWVLVDDESGGRAWVPPVGHVIGAGYIRKMFQNGGLPSVAPAGPSTTFVDALDVEIRRYNDTDLEQLVHQYGVNPTQFLPGRGFIVRTSRTTSTDPKSYSVHIRRSLNFIETSLSDSLGWLEQESNNEVTQARVRQTLKFFFQSLYIGGMFETRGGYDNNVAVKCDDQNNPISLVNQRQLQIDIALRFAEIAETINVNIMHTRTGIVVTEN